MSRLNYKYVLAGLICIVVVLAAVVMLWMYGVSMQTTKVTRTNNVEQLGYGTSSVSALGNVTGTMLIQYAPFGGSISTLYTFDMHSQALAVSQSQYDQPSVSSDGKYIVAAYTMNSSSTPNGIYLFDRTSRTLTLFARTPNFLAKYPSLSPDDSTVVFATHSGTTDMSVPSSWVISIVRSGAAAITIAHGAYPQWGPNSHTVVYLGNDGLHVVDTDTKKDKRVWTAQGQVTTHMQYAISDDAQYIALAAPESADAMYIAHITSWSPFTIESYATLSGHDYNPVFSPDSKYIAYVQYDESMDTTDPASTHRRLMVSDIGGHSENQLADLSRVSGTTLLLNTWMY